MTSIHEETRLVLLIKGKRTKRQRSASPLMNNAAAVSSVSSGEIQEDGEIEFRSEATTDEDEDIANCLMLLSQGHNNDQFSRKMGYLNDKKPVMGSLGLRIDGVYQCKTCDKSFHSFQALGGHRASHKKLKTGGGGFKCEEKITAVETVESRGVVGSFLSLQVTSNEGSSKKREKTHECSICKAEFSSGQALGGHMRRHRGLIVNANATLSTKTAISSSSSSHHHNHQESLVRPKNFLELDLNLPAPEDEPKFTFASKDQILLFASASNSLIDCHH